MEASNSSRPAATCGTDQATPRADAATALVVTSPGDTVRPRLALFGAGRWGRHYLRLLPALGAEVVVCCTRRTEIRTWLGDHHPTVRHTDDAEEALEAGVDGVVVATPRQAHAPLSLAALRRGLHVLVEKPSAPDDATLLRLQREAERNGAVLMTGYTHCHDTSFRALCRVAVEQRATSWSLEWLTSTPSAGAAEVVWEYFPHVFSMALSLASSDGDPSITYCRAVAGTPGTGDVLVDAEIRTGPLVGRVRVHTSDPQSHKRVVLRGTDQTLGVWTDRLLRIPGRGPLRAAGEPLAAEIRAFLDLVRRGGSADHGAGPPDLDVRVTALLADLVARLTDTERAGTGDL